MDVNLIVDNGRTERQTRRLHREETVVGRRRDCDLRILSAEVSRRHCLLSIVDGYVIVEDLDSTNGTFINGRRVVGKQVLRPGDNLEIGPVEFLVEYELTPSAQRRLAQQAARVAGADAGLEVLPVAEEEGEPNALVVADEGELAALKDKERAPDERKKTNPRSVPAVAEEEEPPAVVDDEEAADWHFPQTNALRDLLSQIEKPKAGRQRRRR